MTTRTFIEPEGVALNELSEAWIEAETTAMNLQAAADEVVLNRGEWLYRQGLADQAKAVSEAAWEKFDASLTAFDLSWN